jgi:hypothetical protein
MTEGDKNRAKRPANTLSLRSSFLNDYLFGVEEGGAGLLFLCFSQHCYRAVSYTGSLAVFHAGWLLAAFNSIRTKIAKAGGDENKVHVDFIGTGRNQFIYLNAHHAFREVMLLLAGDLTGMAAGAPIVLYQ